MNQSVTQNTTTKKSSIDTPLIRIDNLSWSYPWAKTNVLEHIDFEIFSWDFCFVLWTSWQWKTTLTKFILRQLTPPKWTIFHWRDDIARYSSREIQRYRRWLWVVFQDCKLLDWKTVRQNISYPLQIDWLDETIIDQRIENVASLLWIDTLLNQYIPTLSGWEKQRVAIARALVRNPEFLIADEPTGNIDQKTSQIIADKCIDINKQWTTILFITHDRSLVEYVQSKHSVKTITIQDGTI